jgi:hypothetical protein
MTRLKPGTRAANAGDFPDSRRNPRGRTEGGEERLGELVKELEESVKSVEFPIGPLGAQDIPVAPGSDEPSLRDRAIAALKEAADPKSRLAELAGTGPGNFDKLNALISLFPTRDRGAPTGGFTVGGPGDPNAPGDVAVPAPEEEAPEIRALRTGVNIQDALDQQREALQALDVPQADTERLQAGIDELSALASNLVEDQRASAEKIQGPSRFEKVADLLGGLAGGANRGLVSSGTVAGVLAGAGSGGVTAAGKSRAETRRADTLRQEAFNRANALELQTLSNTARLNQSLENARLRNSQANYAQEVAILAQTGPVERAKLQLEMDRTRTANLAATYRILTAQQSLNPGANLSTTINGIETRIMDLPAQLRGPAKAALLISSGNMPFPPEMVGDGAGNRFQTLEEVRNHVLRLPAGGPEGLNTNQEVVDNAIRAGDNPEVLIGQLVVEFLTKQGAIDPLAKQGLDEIGAQIRGHTRVP